MNSIYQSNIKVKADYFALCVLLICVSCTTAMRPHAETQGQLPEGKVVLTVKLPDIFPQGTALVKNQLWIIDSKGKMLRKVDMGMMKVTDSIPLNIIVPRGLAWDGKYFWCTDDRNKMVHQIDAASGQIISSLTVPIYTKEESVTLEAVTWDGAYLWVAYSAGWSSRIHKMDKETGEVVLSMFANCHPRGLATDGKYLWVLSYNQGRYTGVISRRTIMDDPVKMNLSEVFICRTPGKEPTGITHDGGYLWVADKDMKSLQKIALPSER